MGAGAGSVFRSARSDRRDVVAATDMGRNVLPADAAGLRCAGRCPYGYGGGARRYRLTARAEPGAARSEALARVPLTEALEALGRASLGRRQIVALPVRLIRISRTLGAVVA